MAKEPNPRRGAIGLEQAYAVDGPDDNRALYAVWADTYEDFTERNHYIYARRVAEIFTERSSEHHGVVLDAGCGTGLVGLELSRLGVAAIDGLDISPEMLAKAQSKAAPDGRPAYRRLIEADLTGPIDLASDSYAGVVSAGTFTHGHVGPDALSEMLRVARPGSVCVIGVNASLFEVNGFRQRFEGDLSAGAIGGLEVMPIPVYEGVDGNDPNHMAQLAVFTVV